jgi:hypothetical protein
MSKRKHTKRTRSLLRLTIWSLLVAGAFSTVIIVSQRQSASTDDHELTMQELLQVQKGFPFYFSEQDAMPFPQTLPAAYVPAGFTRHAYSVAEEIPGVLAQQPCFCECRSMGHKSLLFCYASHHAAGCTICAQEALLAEQMTNAGKTPSQIRNAIINGKWRRQRLE